MLRILLATLGVLLLLIGFIALLSPIPIGLFIMALGACLLVSVEPHARRMVKNLRGRSESFNRRLHWFESKLELRFQRLHDAFRQTRPENKRSGENDRRIG